jgi:Concanavalin A-like lectin/glucanases superfamily
LSSPRRPAHAASPAAKVSASIAVMLVLLVGAATWMFSESPQGTDPRVGKVCPVMAYCGWQRRSRIPSRGPADAYDRQVLRLGPVLYLTMAHPLAGTEEDLSGHGHDGVYLPRHHLPGQVRLPNGDAAAEFDGHGQYLQVRSADALSVTHTGCLTVQAWIRPTTLQFPEAQGSGYVYVLGKGAPGEQEYAVRMYSYFNAEHPARPNRLSGYVFNPRGGKGSGAYFQDVLTVNQWMMVTFVIVSRSTPAWPYGYVALYKNGRERDKVSLNQYRVRPQAAGAPLRIATRDLDSYFEGAVAKVAVYDYVLSAADIAGTYAAMYKA